MALCSPVFSTRLRRPSVEITIRRKPNPAIPHTLNPQLCQPALARINLDCKFAAVLRCHRPLQGFHDGVRHAAIVVKLLCTVAHWYASGLAQKLVMRCLVRILETSPSAHVVNKNCIERCLTAHHILQQLAEALSALEHHPSPPGISVGLNHCETVFLCIFLNRRLLVFNGILLMFRGHPHVLSGRHWRINWHGAPLLSCPLE